MGIWGQKLILNLVGAFYLRLGLLYLSVVFEAYGILAWSSLLMVENRLGLFFLGLTVEHWFGLSVHGSPQSGHWTWSLWLTVPSP